MIKHVIWDFDGTLFDSYPGMVHAFQAALRNYEIESNYEDVLNLFLNSEQTAIQYYRDTYSLSEGFVKDYLKEKGEINLSLMQPFPYALEVCTTIKESGGFNYILTHRSDSTYDILKTNQMIDLFEEVVTKDNQFARKPDPEAMIYLLNKYQINPQEAMIVGDREIEIVLGQNANVKTCFYESGNIELEVQPTYTVKSLKDILNILKIEN